MSFKSMQKGVINTYKATEGAAPSYEKTWALHELNISAGPHQLTGNDRIVDTGKNITADVRFITESTATLLDRVKWQSTIYEIVHVDDPMERGHHIEFYCSLLPNTDQSIYPDA
jgi:head-tail adaptor